MGFKKIGTDVFISEKASIYGAKNITLGNHVRIDDFCVLSGEIEIGNYVHIATGSKLIGHAPIELHDFSGMSFNSLIFSSSDDYSGQFLTNPCVDEKYRMPKHAPVILCKHALVASGAMVAPGVSMGIGSVAGAGAFIRHSVGAFEIWVGNPAYYLKMRSTDILKLESQLKHG